MFVSASVSNLLILAVIAAILAVARVISGEDNASAVNVPSIVAEPVTDKLELTDNEPVNEYLLQKRLISHKYA